jgi:hypothetical protein
MAGDNAIAILVEQRWTEYARPRFAQGNRPVREAAARSAFDEHTQRLYIELYNRARAASKALDYGVQSVQLAVLEALERPCVACNSFFGAETWAAGYRTSPALLSPNRHLLANLTIGCSRCMVARGQLSERVWISVLAALRGENDLIAAEFVDALVVGQMVRASGPGGSKVLPGPAWAQVTRELRGRSSDGRKK